MLNTVYSSLPDRPERAFCKIETTTFYDIVKYFKTYTPGAYVCRAAA